jgi:hypothetical protein
MVCHRYEANASPATILKSSIAHRIVECKAIAGFTDAWQLIDLRKAAMPHRTIKGSFNLAALNSEEACAIISDGKHS